MQLFWLQLAEDLFGEVVSVTKELLRSFARKQGFRVRQLLG